MIRSKYEKENINSLDFSFQHDSMFSNFTTTISIHLMQMLNKTFCKNQKTNLRIVKFSR